MKTPDILTNGIVATFYERVRSELVQALEKLDKLTTLERQLIGFEVDAQELEKAVRRAVGDVNYEKGIAAATAAQMNSEAVAEKLVAAFDKSDLDALAENAVEANEDWLRLQYNSVVVDYDQAREAALLELDKQLLTLDPAKHAEVYNATAAKRDELRRLGPAGHLQHRQIPDHKNLLKEGGEPLAKAFGSVVELIADARARIAEHAAAAGVEMSDGMPEPEPEPERDDLYEVKSSAGEIQGGAYLPGQEPFNRR